MTVSRREDLMPLVGHKFKVEFSDCCVDGSFIGILKETGDWKAVFELDSDNRIEVAYQSIFQMFERVI